MTGRTTLDAIFSGALRLEQPARGHGYRFNVDALLLAREALELGFSERVADLGAGCGVAGLALRFLGGCRQLLLVERDPWVASLAARNATAFEGASAVACAAEDLQGQPPFDGILCNPPYTPPEEGRACPEPRRARARSGELDPFLDSIARALAPQGWALLVYPCQALPTLLAAASRRLLFAHRMRFVHPTPVLPARVVLLELRRFPGAPSVAPPWFERDQAGQPDPTLGSFLAGPTPLRVRPAVMTDPSPPPSPPPSRLDALAALSAGLLLPSETDAPFAVVSLEATPSPETLRAASGMTPDATVEELSLDKLFSDLERETSTPDEQERAEPDRFRKLHTFFQDELKEAKVWRVGQVDVEVWILGKEEGGSWIGLRSHAVET